MRLIVAIAIAFMLVGCGMMLQARVTAFHNLSSIQSPRTFVVVPYDWQKGSLEFQTYEQQIVSELQSRGFQSAPPEQAELVVFLAYAIDGGRNVAYSYPIFGQTGVSSSQMYGTVNSYGNSASYSGTTTYTPSYGVVGSGTDSSTEYTRVVRLELLSKQALIENNIVKVYEGEVVSSGSTGQLSAVMPTLLQALFQDFPGASGKSRTVTLPLR